MHDLVIRDGRGVDGTGEQALVGRRVEIGEFTGLSDQLVRN